MSPATIPLVIIQARIGSTRLPGKVLMEVGGQSVLARIVARVRRARTIGGVVVATSTAPQDQAVAEEAQHLGVDVFRGDEQDVLNRYHDAATAFGAGHIVRVTADCPFIDPGILDHVVGAFCRANPAVDFAANTLQRTYPVGLDVEVASAEALACAWREARQPYQRAHVFPYLYEQPSRFRLLSVMDDEDHAWMRWTLDTQPDLEFVRAVYARFGNDDRMSWSEILQLLEREPALLELNRHVRQKALRDG